MAPPPMPPQRTALPNAGLDDTDFDKPPLASWLPMAMLTTAVVLLGLVVALNRDSADPAVAKKQEIPSAAQPETENAEPAQPAVAMLASVDRVPSLPAVSEPAPRPVEPSASVPEPIKRSPPKPRPALAANQKPAIPDAQSAHRAIAQVRTAYQSDLEKAQSPWRKAELAKELMLRIKEVRNTPEKNYALLHLARRLAIEGGAADVACQAIDELAAHSKLTLWRRSRTPSWRLPANYKRSTPTIAASCWTKCWSEPGKSRC